MNIEKLPKWAQDKIRHLEMQRDEAVKSLNEFIDNQTEAQFYFEDYISTGEDAGPSLKRFYIHTRQMTIEHAGVELNIRIRDNNIELQWEGEYHGNEVAFIPYSFQNARLVSRENMYGSK